MIAAAYNVIDMMFNEKAPIIEKVSRPFIPVPLVARDVKNR